VTPSLATFDVVLSLLLYIFVYVLVYAFGFFYVYRLLRDGLQYEDQPADLGVAAGRVSVTS
jgi:cytochrome d ubiquinol oxidase subunit I